MVTWKHLQPEGSGNRVCGYSYITFFPPKGPVNMHQAVSEAQDLSGQTKEMPNSWQKIHIICIRRQYCAIDINYREAGIAFVVTAI
ncbi:hypothetical protein M9435_002969 [Picochlorum sp. BPE23]|nr:hypothetical protein M9435_002969 [Picochlorum sp. BPE23]